MSLIRGQQDALSLHVNSKLGLSIQGATGSGYQSIYELTVTRGKNQQQPQPTLQKIPHKELESTNRISPVIDCCYAKMCHHPVNLTTTEVNFGLLFWSVGFC